MRGTFWVMLLLAGCGVSFEDFNERRYEAVCNANDACREIQGVEQVGDCTFPTDAVTTEGTCSYNAAAATRCLNEIERARNETTKGCDETNPSVFVVPPVCEEVVTNCGSSLPGGGGDDGDTDPADTESADTDPDDTDAG